MDVPTNIRNMCVIAQYVSFQDPFVCERNGSVGTFSPPESTDFSSSGGRSTQTLVARCLVRPFVIIGSCWAFQMG